MKNVNKFKRMPARFRMKVSDGSMLPLFPAGMLLEFVRIKVVGARAGDDLLIQTRAGTFFQRLVAVRRDTYRFRPLNELFQISHRIKRRDIVALARPEFMLTPVKPVRSDNIKLAGN